jgi:exopolysaccharide biosynthesis predicted pyruvyltransferase EpsI
VPHPDSTLLRSLNTAIDDGLLAALGEARRVSLVHFPDTSSPGDPARWLGLRIALRRLGVRVAYQCLPETLSAEAVQAAEGPLLLSGPVDAGVLASVEVPVVSLFDLKTPPLALALGALPRLGDVDVDVLWHVDGRALSWSSPDLGLNPKQAVAARAHAELRSRAARDPEFARRTWRALSATFVPLAKAQVQQALTVLGGGQVLVTDDLDAHLLALLAGIPHVVLGDLPGGVSDSSLVRTAPDADTAGSLALELL